MCEVTWRATLKSVFASKRNKLFSTKIICWANERRVGFYFDAVGDGFGVVDQEAMMFILSSSFRGWSSFVGSFV